MRRHQATRRLQLTAEPSAVGTILRGELVHTLPQFTAIVVSIGWTVVWSVELGLQLGRSRDPHVLHPLFIFLMVGFCYIFSALTPQNAELELLGEVAAVIGAVQVESPLLDDPERLRSR